MANSVQRDRQGPDWPLGFIAVAAPGTSVDITALVDPTDANDPSTLTSATSDEYVPRAQQIIFQAFKPGVSHGTVPNTGNVYIVRDGVGAGTGNRDDTGSIVVTLTPGQTFTLGSSAMNRNVFSPYRYAVDGDNAGDGVMVTLIIQ
jgi:hypothetical protein